MIADEGAGAGLRIAPIFALVMTNGSDLAGFAGRLVLRHSGRRTAAGIRCRCR